MSIKFCIVFACILAISMATGTPDAEWESFKTKFNKKYANPTEEAFRKKIFLDNWMDDEQHNRLFAEGKVTFTIGVNQFSDMTTEEFNKKMNGYVMEPDDPSVPVHQHSGAPAPLALDWRNKNNKNYVTRVKYQGECGCCWAFAATGSVESIRRINTGDWVELSEQELIDCATPKNRSGCNGGNRPQAYNYIISNKGLSKEIDYPYEETKGNCRPRGKQSAIREYRKITPFSEDDLLDAVAQQPVSVAVDADHKKFKKYSGGIYHRYFCSKTKLTHAMLVVGYGTESGNDYWIVKNSWGTSWGEKGYIRMSRNRNNNCGIATRAFIPIY